MNEVCGGAEIRGEVGIVFYRGQRCGCATVAVFPDERIDGFIFAKHFHSGCEDDELGIVGQGHARAVDGLVSQPRTFEFSLVKVDDCLLDGAVEHFEIGLEAEGGGEFEALHIVADEESAQHQ